MDQLIQDMSKLSVDSQLTLGMMFAQTLCMFIQTVLVIATIWIAAQWRLQFIGQKKIELALELQGIAWDVSHSFSEAIRAIEQKTEDSADKLTRAYDQVERLSKIIPIVHAMFGELFVDQYGSLREIHSELKNIHQKLNKEIALTPDERKLLDIENHDEEGNGWSVLGKALGPIFVLSQGFTRDYRKHHRF